jgi:hypothetical protein
MKKESLNKLRKELRGLRYGKTQFVIQRLPLNLRKKGNLQEGIVPQGFICHIERCN